MDSYRKPAKPSRIRDSNGRFVSTRLAQSQGNPFAQPPAAPVGHYSPREILGFFAAIVAGSAVIWFAYAGLSAMIAQ